MRLKSEKSMVVEKKKIDGLDKPKAEMLREEWNAAIKAAAKVAQKSWTRADLTPSQTARIARKILNLKK